ncbi:MAG: hypothetical protein EAZ97_13495 [Bacteroidetes bacterium]|nr:MAG: hypothetical protein EAZ97_13495 [Bacteroidota bacterium]
MELYKSRFFGIKYFEESKTIYSFWVTEDMTIEQYKSELTIYANFCREYKPVNYLVNNSNSSFTITPDIQDWIVKNIFSLTMHKDAKKFALVVSPDLFAQVSIEQVVDDNPNIIQTVYFDSDQSAWNWINNK